jgi:hypothetical protein
MDIFAFLSLLVSAQPGSPVLLPEADEVIYRPVVGSFGICRKKAGGQFSAPAVIMQAVAAYRILAAGIAAVTILAVPVLFTFHCGIVLFV